MLAAVAVLPTIVPLTQRIGTTEDVADVAEVLAASRSVSMLYKADVELTPGLARSLEVDGVDLLDAGNRTIFRDGELPQKVALPVMCPPGEPPGKMVLDGPERWAVACLDFGGGRAVAAVRATHRDNQQIGYLILGLAAMVGISTAFGVLQILSPLSKIQAGLELVGAGSRGIRLQSTGLTELDALIDQLNGAARALEDREDAILGRIAVVQEMARMVAHEIRNPLQSLELLAGLIAAEEDPKERAELATSIQDEVRVLERVVYRMLREREGSPALRLSRTPTSIRDIVGKVIAFRLPEARHRGITVVQGPVVDRTLDLDRALISRALENLVSNAVAAAPAGPGRVVVSVVEEGEFLVIQVDDNGPGVAQHLGDSIYQPGVTDKPDGLGLGLALVQGVISAHDGHIEHGRSSMGGASFRVVLPRTAGPDTTLPPTAQDGSGYARFEEP